MASKDTAELMDDRAERILFVHAHPDDETIATGGTIATLIDRGAAVTVLTCTRGELGEVIPADIADLAGTDRLAPQRERELAAAMNLLGVRDHRWLGDADARWEGRPARRYTDSGMQWGPSGAEPLDTISEDSLCAAEFGEVASDIASVIEQVKPTAVVSYDPTGGYHHPDHIRAHETSRRAADVMGVPFFAIQPEGTAGTISVEYGPVVDRKRAALTAYRSQVAVEGDAFTLSSGPARRIDAPETYTRMRETADERPRWRDQGVGVHILTYLLMLVIGAALGGILTVEHQYTIALFGLPAFPVGIIASMAIAAGLFVGCRLVFESRLVVLSGAIGMVVVIGILSLAGGGGSILVPANPIGYVLVYGSTVLALGAIVWPTTARLHRDKLGATAKTKGTATS